MLDLEAHGYLLAERVPGYTSGDTHLIDFVLFLKAVEIPIERKGQLWSGWIRSADRHVSWRMDNGIVHWDSHLLDYATLPGRNPTPRYYHQYPRHFLSPHGQA